MHRNLKAALLSCIFIFSNGILASAQSNGSEENSTEETSKVKGFVNTVMNLPFTFDFGCEPALHGSTTYLHFKYNWSDKRFSKLIFNYSRTLETTSIGGSSWTTDKASNEEKKFDVKFAPYCFKFVDTNDSNKYFTVEPGLGYLYENLKIDVDLWSAIDESHYAFQKQRDTVKNHLIKPFVELTGKYPVNSFMTINLDVTVSPVYFMFYKAGLDIQGYDAVRNSYSLSGNTELFGISTPEIETTLDVTLFNLVAASVRFKYEHLKMQFPVFNGDAISSKDTVTDTFVLRIGGSLVNVGKASTRFKTGLFYEWQWTKQSTSPDFEKKGKWIFGVGAYSL